MNTPPLLLGVSILFWGWLTGLPAIAIGMALLLEGSRLVPLRWNFTTPDFNRISDLCAVIFLGIAAYRFLSGLPFHRIFIQWFPVVFFPLIIAQAYSTRKAVDIAALFMVVRRRHKKKKPKNPMTIDLTYPYLILVIASSGAANHRTPLFYIACVLQGGWALWFYRSKRFSAISWGLLFLVAASMGYAGHVCLHDLQKTIEQKALRWYIDFLRQDADPYRSHTTLGDMGELKPSNEILFRVEFSDRRDAPILLREAVYNAFWTSDWYARNTKFTPVYSENRQGGWRFAPDIDGIRSVSVSGRFPNGKGLLKLPLGVTRIENLNAESVEKNHLGAVGVQGVSRFVQYRAFYQPHFSTDAPPDEYDRIVPRKEKPMIHHVAQELDLFSKEPQNVLDTVYEYFLRDFSYSLVQETGSSSPITRFLSETRSGHCEFFAAASVLLLREAGIPARYVTGYSVHEYSPFEKKYLVREKHAHAWALAYVNHRWQTFDATPPDWRNVEAQNSPFFGFVSDFMSWTLYRFNQWRYGDKDNTRVLYWFLIPLILILIIRFKKVKDIQRTRVETVERPVSVKDKNMASDIYRIEEWLVRLGYQREPAEPLSLFFNRAAANSNMDHQRLHDMLKRHYTLRFDPEGLTLSEKHRLNQDIHQWLDEHQFNIKDIHHGNIGKKDQ